MELLDIYDNDGNNTRKTIIRGDKTVKLNVTEHIALSVVFIENEDGKFVIQKTSKEKGNVYSTTGGHVNHGENPIDAIIREVKEELGLDIIKKQIKDYGFINYDMPLRYLFYLKGNIDIKGIILQKSEVESVEYFSVEEIMTMINNKTFLESHGILFKELLSRRKK